MLKLAEPLLSNRAFSPSPTPSDRAKASVQEPILRRVTRTWIAVATSAQRLDAQRQIRLRNVVLFALCVLSIVLMMASLEVALVMPEDDEKHKTPTLYYEKSLRNFFAAAQLGVTLLCWAVLYAYYALKWQTNCRHSLARRDPAAAAETNARVPPLHRSHFWKPFLVELVVLGVQPLPWMDQDWYELLSLAIFARLYVGLRVLRDFSPIYAHRDELVAQASLPKLEAVSTLRIVYALNPARLLLCAFGLLFGILGFTMHVTERATNRDFHSFLVSYYFTWTTFTTVGYGDVVPRDKRGRVVAGVTCLVGLVFTALVIALVADALRLRAPEARIVGLHRERALWARQRKAAASLIQNLWRGRRERARSTGGAQRSVAEQRRWRRLDVLHRLEKQRRRRLLHRADAAWAQPSSANDVRRRLDALEQGQQRILSLLIEITGDLRRDVGISPPPVGSPHGSAPMFMSPGL